MSVERSPSESMKISLILGRTKFTYSASCFNAAYGRLHGWFDYDTERLPSKKSGKVGAALGYDLGMSRLLTPLELVNIISAGYIG